TGPKAAAPAASQVPDVPILLYHRFGPAVVDGMTIKTSVFEEHLKYLKENGYHVIPLRQLVDYYLKKGPAPAPKSVVIVEDDAHKSVYSDMLPLAKKYNIPVTVFVYPSAISNAKYATVQLKKSKERLEKEVGGTVDLLAWPFGIYDDYLLKKAADAGYKATFTIQAHHAGPQDTVMKLPRYLLINADQGKNFARILEGTAPKR